MTTGKRRQRTPRLGPCNALSYPYFIVWGQGITLSSGVNTTTFTRKTSECFGKSKKLRKSKGTFSGLAVELNTLIRHKSFTQLSSEKLFPPYTLIYQVKQEMSRTLLVSWHSEQTVFDINPTKGTYVDVLILDLFLGPHILQVDGRPWYGSVPVPGSVYCDTVQVDGERISEPILDPFYLKRPSELVTLTSCL